MGCKPGILVGLEDAVRHFRVELEGRQSKVADVKKNVSKEQVQGKRMTP